MQQDTFGLVKFALGPAERPGDDHLDFYAKVAKLVTGRNMRRLRSSSAFHTLAVARLLEDEKRLYEPLYSALAEVDGDAGLAILDLSGAQLVDSELLLHRCFPHVAAAIKAVFCQAEWAGRTLVTLLPTMEVGHVEAMRQLEVDPIIVLSDDGRSSSARVDGDEYAALLDALHPRAIDQLQAKLIVRLGWFPSGAAAGQSVRRHHFDASRAQNELGQLLEDFIRADAPQPRPDLVVFHDRPSGWLANPLKGACIAADSLRLITLADVADPDANVLQFQDKRVLLVVPVVHTGTALSRQIDLVTQRLNPAELRILAVLCTGGQRGCRRIMDGSGQGHEVRYLLSVNQLTVPAEDPHLGIFGPTGRETLRTGSLSTAEFWDLVRTCGVRAEANIPERRVPGFPSLPDIPSMIDQYGGWLADKMWTSIRRHTATVPQDILLVCPDREEGSRKLSHCLSRMTGARVVRIPREAIERVVTEESANGVLDDAAPWCQELDSLDLREVVLIDDLVGDGSTINALHRIVTAKKLRVAATCTLLDLAPANATDRNYLYGWQEPVVGAIPRQRQSRSGVHNS